MQGCENGKALFLYRGHEVRDMTPAGVVGKRSPRDQMVVSSRNGKEVPTVRLCQGKNGDISVTQVSIYITALRCLAHLRW